MLACEWAIRRDAPPKSEPSLSGLPKRVAELLKNKTRIVF
jgi:hypothetical protein